MNQEEIQNQINNKKLEVKNKVFLNKEKIEKLKKYDINKIIHILIVTTILLLIVNYFNNFIGLPFLLFIVSSITLIISIILNFYVKSTIRKLNNEIKKLEFYFKELDTKNITKG